MTTCLEDLVRRRAEEAAADVVAAVTVQSVLDEMIGDIETWVYESEIHKLKSDLKQARTLLSQHAVTERMHWDEKQNMLQKLHIMQIQGREIAMKLKREAELVAQEMEERQRLEQELQECKDKLASFSSLTKELARAQREIRDLHRRQSIQSILRKSPVPSPHVTQKPRKGLVSLPDKLLLAVFSYIDAKDVLAVSLTCHAWRNRVHVLFGIEREKKVVMPPTPPKPVVNKAKPVAALDKTQLAKADELLRSLNAKDVRFFHDLMMRMKQLEANLVSVQAEKEDLAARLQGAENVRDFLMEKLTDVEDALSLSMDEKAKADAQSALDREVMAYLDTKSQEMEVVLQSYAAQNEQYMMELDRESRQHQAKTQVLEDMIRHLTDEKNDLELQAKAQKKVLVKEVRTLRAENARLTSERDLYRGQLQQLKQSLAHLDALSI